MCDDVRSCVVIVTVVSAVVIRRSVVWQTDANNQYNRIGSSDFFGNRIDSLSESNRIYSNRELECSTLKATVKSRYWT